MIHRHTMHLIVYILEDLRPNISEARTLAPVGFSRATFAALEHKSETILLSLKGEPNMAVNA